jgi:hypothetical protein
MADDLHLVSLDDDFFSFFHFIPKFRCSLSGLAIKSARFPESASDRGGQ